MATFTEFSNILPDPVNKITDSGYLNASGNPGPGFAGVNFSSNGETDVSRTNSGRGVQRYQRNQYWSFSIKYNPMKRELFEPVDSFLASRNGRANPFFVILPQYARPRDTAFATYAAANVIRTAAAYNAGASVILIDATGTILGNPKPGDMFSITDPENVNHLKVYKITRVETNAIYQAGTIQPTTLQRRIHISPPLQRNTSDNSVVNFINPKFRVIARSDVREHELNTDNLYQFSLDVEEIQP